MNFPGTFIDAHCHLSDPRLYGRIEEVMSLSKDQGIGEFVLGGVDPADWDRQLELKKRFPGVIWPCFGVHPWFVAGRMGAHGDGLRAQVQAALIKLPSYLNQGVGLGELGLDLGSKTDPATEAFQVEVFREQLKISRDYSLPLVLHVVRAHDQALRTLTDHGPFPQGGIVHAFGASFEVARQYRKLGFHLSVGGAVASLGHDSLKRCLKKVPLDWLVFESDSPDQRPEGFSLRYQEIEPGLNDPRSLHSVVLAMVELRGDPKLRAEHLLEASRDRLKQIFQLELPEKSL